MIQRKCLAQTWRRTLTVNSWRKKKAMPGASEQFPTQAPQVPDLGPSLSLVFCLGLVS